MKYIKLISWFLGISMFMFGILKFVDPFKYWYSIQISTSGLGDIAYAMGIVGEIAVGLLFIISLLFQKKISKLSPYMLYFASFIVIAMMITGIYIHLIPDVPAEVLPLKIKPPFIPAFFLIVALSNMIMIKKHNKLIQ